MAKIKFKINKANSNLRLDYFLSKKLFQISRSKIQKTIKEGLILVNKKNVKPGYLLREGDLILGSFSFKNKNKLTNFGSKIKLKIIYEDNNFLVIDKPPGIVVYPGLGREKKSILGAIYNRIKNNFKNSLRPGIVHRLDKDTSGLLLIAKNRETQNYLLNLFKKRKVFKKYLALLKGHLTPSKGIIKAPIGRDLFNRQKMSVVCPGEGKEAVTEYRVIKYYNNYTLVEVLPKTGRTHQIRVHFASLGFPLLGDKIYGHKKDNFLVKRHFLHASYLKFKMPSGEIKEFKSPIPSDFQKIINFLDKKYAKT